MEIPSGILADKTSRRTVVILGRLSFLLGILTFILVPNFAGFLIGAILWGINESFVSGAQQALIYDELKTHHKESLFNKVYAIVTTSREIGLGMGVLIAGFVTHFGFKYNLFGSVIIATLGFLLCFLIPKAKQYPKNFEIKFIQYFQKSLKTIKKENHLKLILLFSITVLVSYSIISEYFVVSLKFLDIPYYLIGLLAFFEMLFFSLGSYISQKINTKKYNIVFLVLSILMTLGMLLITRGTVLFVVSGFMFLRVIKAISEIYTESEWQKYSESKERATLGSVRSFSMNLVYVIFAYMFGRIADSRGLFNGFILASVISLSFIAVYLFSKPTNYLRREKI